MEAFRLQIPFAKSDYFPDERTNARTNERTNGQVSFERSKVQSASRNNYGSSKTTHVEEETSMALLLADKQTPAHEHQRCDCFSAHL